ncbi:hypothetical protein [Streptomyces sp. NPDC056663]|uniref:hypothetical protein n=1 Tax=Streptomyces sp. NPDC056663 TaxID=3345899 RepID=UPI0036A45CE3
MLTPLAASAESMGMAPLSAGTRRATTASHDLGQHRATIRKGASDRATPPWSGELGPVRTEAQGVGAGAAG